MVGAAAARRPRLRLHCLTYSSRAFADGFALALGPLALASGQKLEHSARLR
jgi:hypothetical protein